MHRRTYVILVLFISLFFSILTLRFRTSEGRLVGSWGYSVVLISRDWILRLVPLFSGRWANFPEFCQKLDRALIWRVVVSGVARNVNWGPPLPCHTRPTRWSGRVPRTLYYIPAGVSFGIATWHLTGNSRRVCQSEVAGPLLEGDN